MKKIVFFIVLPIFFIMLPSWRSFEANGEECALKRGVIKSIELDSRTCVVEVPLDGQFYTVGGVVSHNAVLKKGGVKTRLENFRVGDMVWVGWRKIATGHKIEFLEAISQLPGEVTEKAVPSPVDDKLLGTPQRHQVQKKETLLDIARQYDLGLNEIQDLYPDLDPWIPPGGDGIDNPITANIARRKDGWYRHQRSRIRAFTVAGKGSS